MLIGSFIWKNLSEEKKRSLSAEMKTAEVRVLRERLAIGEQYLEDGHRRHQEHPQEGPRQVQRPQGATDEERWP